ncbi:TniQ family protein [Spongiibacter marinus]|uniref:TniQ family protein n=1 Tax=Spongiibacter marinus TaxID=354246 RepID=UPI0035BE9E1E
MQEHSSLFFKPTMYRSESLGSAMLRLSGSHAERPSVYLKMALDKHYETATAVRTFSSRLPTELQMMINTDRWEPPELYQKLVGDKGHKSWFNFKRASVCPACAEEGHLPLYHDLTAVTACAKHGMNLISTCPSCNQPVTWNRRGLSRCVCYASIDVREPAELAAVIEARLIKKWLHTGDQAALQTYINAKGLFQSRFDAWPAARPALLDFIDGKLEKMCTLLRSFIPNGCQISIKAIVTPLLFKADGIYKERFTALENEMFFSHASFGKLPKQFHLTRGEVIYTLGTTWRVVDELAKTCLPSYTITGKAKYAFSRDTIDSLLRVLGAEPSMEPGQCLRDLVSLTKTPVATWVQSLLDGKYVVTRHGAGLLDVQISTAVSPRETIPDGYVTMPEAAEYLDLYPEAVRRMIKSGLIESDINSITTDAIFFRSMRLGNFEKSTSLALNSPKHIIKKHVGSQKN